MTAREYMARKLKEVRKARGLSVKDVGEALGKSDRTISAWEVGRGQPDADTLVQLCSFLNANISDFYFDETSSYESEEDELVNCYRKMSPDMRHVVLDFIRDLSEL